jgi:hypothetical protein
LQVHTNSLTYRATSQTQNLSPQKHQTFKQNTHKPNKKKTKKTESNKMGQPPITSRLHNPHQSHNISFTHVSAAPLELKEHKKKNNNST